MRSLRTEQIIKLVLSLLIGTDNGLRKDEQEKNRTKEKKENERDERKGKERKIFSTQRSFRYMNRRTKDNLN